MRERGEYLKKYRAQPEHKEAAWAANLRHKFNMSVDEYNRINEGQRGLCMICNRRPEESRKGDRRLHVDHDHNTGRIRGLLCQLCNIGIGAFRDSSSLLFDAAKYLSRK